MSPIYEFLQEEILKKRDLPVDERVMYDDVNEFFWSRSRSRSYLTIHNGLALSEVRIDVRGAAQHARPRMNQMAALHTSYLAVHKTFMETVSVAACSMSSPAC